MEADVIGMLEQEFLVSLAPLQRVGSQFARLSLEDWIEEGLGNDPEDWLKEEQREQEAWQPPEMLANCLQALIAKLHNNPDVFSDLAVTDAYFIQGYFRQDLLDLLAMVEWATGHGAESMRLVIA
jgi:hypothetical protein